MRRLLIHLAQLPVCSNPVLQEMDVVFLYLLAPQGDGRWRTGRVGAQGGIGDAESKPGHQ